MRDPNHAKFDIRANTEQETSSLGHINIHRKNPTDNWTVEIYRNRGGVSGLIHRFEGTRDAEADKITALKWYKSNQGAEHEELSLPEEGPMVL